MLWVTYPFPARFDIMVGILTITVVVNTRKSNHCAHDYVNHFEHYENYYYDHEYEHYTNYYCYYCHHKLYLG